MIAVRLWGSQPQPASTAVPNGPRTVSRRSSPSLAARMACIVPSPPSAMGHSINWASGNALARPAAMARATSAASRLSLNESGAMTIFMMILLSG